MNTLIPSISELVINIAEVGLFFYFITHQLNIKPNKGKLIPLCIVVLTAIVTIFNFLSVNVYFSMLFFLFAQILLTFLLMEGTPSEKFLVGCFYEIIDFLSDGLTFFISGFLTSASASDLASKYPERYILISVYLLLLVTFVFIFTRNTKQHFVLPYWLLLLFSILVIVGVIAIESLLGLVIALPRSSPRSFFLTLYMVIIIFLIIFAFLIALLMSLSRIYQNNLELLEISQQKNLEESNFNQVRNTIQTLRSWKHDSKHYLSVLEELIDHEKYNDASEYIHDLCKSYEKSTWEIFTGNSIIDAMISTKLLIIRRSNIRFIHSIYLPDNLPFDSISLSSLMGNLFDNAIEACRRMRDGSNAYIDLTIKPLQTSLSITMINSCSGRYNFSREHFLMTTKHSPNHGIGLKRIRSIVEEADGFCQIKPYREKFLVNIIIPLK